MKKLLVLLIGILLLGGNVFADTKYNIDDYNVLSITEALKDEGISFKEDEYVTNDNQVTVYMFRGKGCGFCKKFLNYVNDTLNKEYGMTFTIKTFEVWYDQDNAELFAEAAEAFNESAGGVPYIIIGDKTFGGYAESFNSQIESAIKELYDTPEDERPDLFKKLNGEKVVKRVNKKANIILLSGGGLVVIAFVGIYLVSKKNNSDYDE